MHSNYRRLRHYESKPFGSESQLHLTCCVLITHLLSRPRKVMEGIYILSFFKVNSAFQSSTTGLITKLHIITYKT